MLRHAHTVKYALLSEVKDTFELCLHKCRTSSAVSKIILFASLSFLVYLLFLLSLLFFRTQFREFYLLQIIARIYFMNFKTFDN